MLSHVVMSLFLFYFYFLFFNFFFVVAFGFSSVFRLFIVCSFSWSFVVCMSNVPIKPCYFIVSLYSFFLLFFRIHAIIVYYSSSSFVVLSSLVPFLVDLYTFCVARPLLLRSRLRFIHIFRLVSTSSDHQADICSCFFLLLCLFF